MSNTSNTIIIYCNTGNTILLYGYTGATRATPYLYIATQEQHHTYILQHGQHHAYISIAMRVLHHHSLRLCHRAKTLPHPPPFYYNINTISLHSIKPQSDNNNFTNNVVILYTSIFIILLLSQNVQMFWLKNEFCRTQLVTVASLHQFQSCAFCSWWRNTVQNVRYL